MKNNKKFDAIDDFVCPFLGALIAIVIFLSILELF